MCRRGEKAPLAVCVTDSDGYLSIIQRCHSQNKMLFIVRLAWGRGRQTGAGRESLKHTIAQFTRVISAAASFIHRKSKQHISVCWINGFGRSEVWILGLNHLDLLAQTHSHTNCCLHGVFILIKHDLLFWRLEKHLFFPSPRKLVLPVNRH